MTLHTHLLNEDLSDVAVIIEGGQMQGGKAVLLLHVHQLSCSAENLLRGSVKTSN